MGRAIGIPESGDFLRVQLNTAGRRTQRLACGIEAEILEQHKWLLRLGNFHEPLAPEGIEFWGHIAIVAPVTRHGFVDVPQPLHFRAPRRETVFVATARGQFPVYVEVVAAGSD